MSPESIFRLHLALGYVAWLLCFTVYVWPWLKTLQNTGVEQSAYEYCSTGQIHQWSELAASETLYESLLVMENYPHYVEARKDLPVSVSVDPVAHRGAQTKLPLMALVIPGPTLRIKIIFNRTRIDFATATQVATHVKRLLQWLTSAPEPHVNELGTLIPTEEILIVRGAAAKPVPEASPTPSYVPPRNNLELALVNIWKKVFALDSIGIQDSFFALGGHSLLALRLLLMMNQRFGNRLRLSQLFQADTIEKMAAEIRRSTPPESWSPMVPIRTGSLKPPLFCVHPAGGNVLCYAELAAELDVAQPVYGLQSQGLDGSLESQDSIEEMAATYLAAIRKIQPDGPYLLAGWSFGGVVAFEIARQLNEQGERFPVLALLDAYAPAWMPRKLAGDRAEFLISLLGGEVEVSLKEIRSLDPDEQLARVLTRAHQRKLVPREFDLELAKRFLEINDRARLAANTYRPRKYAGPVQLFRCREEVSLELLRCNDPRLGWGELIDGSIDVQWVSGHHQNMVRQPHVKEIAAALSILLARVDYIDSID